jgi:hypothetical protein
LDAAYGQLGGQFDRLVGSWGAREHSNRDRWESVCLEEVCGAQVLVARRVSGVEGVRRDRQPSADGSSFEDLASAGEVGELAPDGGQSLKGFVRDGRRGQLAVERPLAGGALRVG